MGPDKSSHENRSSSRDFARLSGIITILPASMGAGWLLGYFLIDRLLNCFPWGSISLTLIGAGAGFYEIISLLGPERSRGEDSRHGKG